MRNCTNLKKNFWHAALTVGLHNCCAVRLQEHKFCAVPAGDGGGAGCGRQPDVRRQRKICAVRREEHDFCAVPAGSGGGAGCGRQPNVRRSAATAQKLCCSPERAQILCGSGERRRRYGVRRAAGCAAECGDRVKFVRFVGKSATFVRFRRVTAAARGTAGSWMCGEVRRQRKICAVRREERNFCAVPARGSGAGACGRRRASLQHKKSLRPN